MRQIGSAEFQHGLNRLKRVWRLAMVLVRRPLGDVLERRLRKAKIEEAPARGDQDLRTPDGSVVVCPLRWHERIVTQSGCAQVTQSQYLTDWSLFYKNINDGQAGRSPRESSNNRFT